VYGEDEDVGEEESEDEAEDSVLLKPERDARCFWRASCWECRRRYFCSVKPRSGDLWMGLPSMDIFDNGVDGLECLTFEIWW